MKPTLYILTICLFTSGLHAQQSPANIRLKDVTLMHEMRATPSPLDKAVVADRIVSFQWPLQEGLYVVESGLDGLDTKHKIDKSKVRYSLRYSQDPTFQDRSNAGGNPLAVLQSGERFDSRRMVLAIR